MNLTNDKDIKNRLKLNSKINIKNISKKAVCLMLAALMLASAPVSSLAAEANTTQNAQAVETYTFSLEEAIDYAVANNKDIMAMKLTLDQMGYSISSVRSSRKQLTDAIEALQDAGLSVSQNMSSSFQTYLLRQKYTERKTQSQKDLLAKSREILLETTKLMVENAYYNVQIKRGEYEDSLRNYYVVLNQTNAGQIKLNYGTLSEMDFKSLEISLKASEMSLASAEFAYKEAKMDFNELLGIGLTAEVELTTPITINPKEIVLTEEKKDELRKNDITFLTAQDTYNFEVEYEKYAKAYYGSSSNDYKAIKAELAGSVITYENAKNTLERKILTTYNNLETLGKTVKIMQDKAELMRLALGITNVRKTYGTATEDDVVTASINYNTALNEYFETVMNYNMLVSMYDKNIMG